MSNYENEKYNNTMKDPTILGTSGMVVPVGTTAQQPGSPALGTLRYNTDKGLAEFYTITGWAAVDAPPTVTSYSGIINENTSSTITITGTGFKTGSVVYITGSGVSNSNRSLTTTYVSAVQLTAQTNATSINFVAGARFGITVLNPSGLSGSLDPAGYIDADPVWATASGTIATINDRFGSYSPIATVSAADPDSTSVVYGVTSGYALPAGMSLNTSNGQISGQPTNTVTTSTTYTFYLDATSNGQTVPRQFSIVVNPAPDGTAQTRAGLSANSIKTLTGTTTDGVYWLKNSDNSVQYQAHCLMSSSYDGGGYAHVMSIRTNDGTNHIWGDTTWWQGANTVGTPSAWYNDCKTGVFQYMTGFTQILMLSYSGNGTYRAHARWSFISPYNNGSYTFRSIMNISDNSTGQNVITGSRQVQTGSTTGATINTQRPQTSWGCEFIDNGSGCGQALVVNWNGANTGAKYSFWNDTVNQIRISTINRGDQYGHTFASGVGGHHERPPGSYPSYYEYEPCHAYCDPPYHFGTDGYNYQTAGYCSQGTALDISIAIFLK